MPPPYTVTPGQPQAGAVSLDINALLEFSQRLNQLDEPAAIFSNILLSVMGKLGLGRAAVALPTPDGTFRVEHVKGGAGQLRGMRLQWDEQCNAGILDLDAVPDEVERARLRDARIERIMPICFGTTTFAIVLLGTPLTLRISGTDESNYATLVGTIAAMALEGCRVRGSLRHRVHRLRDLFETSKEFNALLDRDAILRLLGLTLMGGMAIARFAVVLRRGDGFDVMVNRFRRELPDEALGDLLDAGAMILDPAGDDAPLRSMLYAHGIRASIPMEAQGAARGLLLIGERLQQKPIEDDDVEYLSSLANLATIALENSRLLTEMIEKQRLEEDLKIAWEIQQGLLPKSLPKLPGFQIAAETIPARQVGGDCYDIIDLGRGRVLLSIADVSGKGTPASLLMANVQAALRALAPLELPLTEMVSRINDVIYENTSYDKFITGFFGVLDSSDGSFHYVNAGHNPPYLFSGSGIQSLDAGGLILGVMPTTIPYESGSAKMEPGDLLVLYTDGVSEALNNEREEYGEERLHALFADHYSIPAVDALARARADLLAFVCGAQQSDDITLVTVRRE
jgi:sigma-B regulation protein RsbU (phosphoserine phosphatase)